MRQVVFEENFNTDVLLSGHNSQTIGRRLQDPDGAADLMARILRQHSVDDAIRQRLGRHAIAFMGDDERPIGVVPSQRLDQTAIARAEAVNSGDIAALVKQLGYEFLHARALIEAFQNGQYLAARKVRFHGSGKTFETFLMVANLQRTGDDRKRAFGSVGEKSQKPRRRASRRTVVDADIMRPRRMPEIGYERDGVDALLSQSVAGRTHGVSIDRDECYAVRLACGAVIQRRHERRFIEGGDKDEIDQHTLGQRPLGRGLQFRAQAQHEGVFIVRQNKIELIKPSASKVGSTHIAHIAKRVHRSHDPVARLRSHTWTFVQHTVYRGEADARCSGYIMDCRFHPRSSTRTIRSKMRYVNQKMLAIHFFSSRINGVRGWGSVAFAMLSDGVILARGAFGRISHSRNKQLQSGLFCRAELRGRNTFGGADWYQPAASRCCLEEICMKRRNFLTGALVAAALGIGAMASTPVYASPENPVIGFSIDDLRVERWARDRDYFIEAAETLGAKVNVQSADGNEEKQVKQVENLIAQGVDAIVIVPMNSKVFDAVVADAKASGIKVLSYDRLILNADIDAYISFDNERVGFMQAEAVLKAKPEGNYYLLGGSPTDNNAKLLRAGQEKAPQGSHRFRQGEGHWLAVGQGMEPDGSALHHGKRADGCAEQDRCGRRFERRHRRWRHPGACCAGLAGKTAVSGQDSDLAAVKRLIDGTQTVTVYKPLKLIASEAAKLTVQMVKGETPEFNSKLDNGGKQVDTLLLTPTAVTKDNIDIYVQDGFYTKEQIYGK